jgi:hypothetical protein
MSSSQYTARAEGGGALCGAGKKKLAPGGTGNDR